MAAMTPDQRAPKPLVYISVLNWNGADSTICCLESLARLDYPNYRILIVDNASIDDSVARIQAAFPDLEIICSPENLGYAGGNRLALERAMQDGAELFWVLNNDTVVEPEALTALVESYQRHGLAVYGSVTLQPGEQRLVAFGGGWQLDTKGRPRATGKYNLLYGRPYEACFADKRDRHVAAVNGSSLMVPLAVVEKYGFMDESFFMYAEESDYCFRLGKRGVPSILVPNSVVVHKETGLFKASFGRQVLHYYMIRNNFVFLRRHEPRLACLKLYRYFKTNWKFQLLAFFSPIKAHARSELRYYEAMAIRHAVLGRTGKCISPEDYIACGMKSHHCL